MRQNVYRNSVIYALMVDKEVVYIGQSSNVYRRIGQHVEENTKTFNKWRLIKNCEGLSQLDVDEWEMHFIGKFRPIYNEQHKDVFFFKSEQKPKFLTKAERLQHKAKRNRMRKNQEGDN